MGNILFNSLNLNKNTYIEEEIDFKYNAPHNFEVLTTDGQLVQSIHFQEGPIKEVGINGVTNEDLLMMVLRRLECFQNSEFACRENALMITSIEQALLWSKKRTLDREIRNVEGYNKK